MNTVPSLRLPLQSRLLSRFHALCTIDFALQSRDLCDAASLHEDLADLFERRSLDPLLRDRSLGEVRADDAGRLLGHPARPLGLYEGDAGRSDYLGQVAASPAAPVFQASPA